MHLVFSAIAMGFFFATTSFNTCQAASNTARQLHYRAHHPVFGDIGTYSNTIETTGDTTTVLTSVHLKVAALGVVLHREDAERTERWKAGRLVYFRGVTTTNEQVVEVKGEARGDTFSIISPFGNVTAPATVLPSNPSSANSLRSNTIMRTDTGKIEQVRISAGEPAFVNIGGTDIWARKFQIDGSIPYKIWIDQQNTPVMFAVDDDSGEISFILAK
jgi:Family of unknown function (DUF6134)